MARKSLKYRIEFLFLKIMVALTSISFIRIGLASVTSFVLKDILGYRKVVISRNIRNSYPNLGTKEEKDLKNRFYQHLSHNFIDGLWSLKAKKDPLVKQLKFENTELLTDLLKESNGVILLGSHYCNWEWPAIAMPQFIPYDIVGVYKPMSNPFSEKYVKKNRSRFGFKLTPMSKSLRYIHQNKNKKGIYLFISDQSPASSNQVCWINFLNQNTAFLNGGARIALKYNYPVVFMDVYPDTDQIIKVKFELIMKRLESDDVCSIMQKYAAKLERRINHVPHLWLWSHKRWKLNKMD